MTERTKEQLAEFNKEFMKRDMISRLKMNAGLRKAELEADISALEEEMSALKALKEQVSAVEEWLTESGSRLRRRRRTSEVKAAAFLEDADFTRRQWDEEGGPEPDPSVVGGQQRPLPPRAYD